MVSVAATFMAFGLPRRQEQWAPQVPALEVMQTCSQEGGGRLTLGITFGVFGGIGWISGTRRPW